MKGKASTEPRCACRQRESGACTLAQKHTLSRILPHTHTDLIKFTDVKALLTKAKTQPPPLRPLSHHSPVRLSLHSTTRTRPTRTAPRVLTVNAMSFNVIAFFFLSLATLQHTHTRSRIPSSTHAQTERASVSRQLLIRYVADRTVINFQQQNKHRKKKKMLQTSLSEPGKVLWLMLSCVLFFFFGLHEDLAARFI